MVVCDREDYQSIEKQVNNKVYGYSKAYHEAVKKTARFLCPDMEKASSDITE